MANATTPAPRFTLIGGGRLARAVGRILAKRATPGSVHVYARSTAARAEMRSTLPGLTVHDDLGTALEGARIVFLAVPASALLEVSEQYGEYATGDQIVLSATRGVGPGFMLPHEMIRARTCVRKIGVLGGPLHARELESGRQINAVIASRFSEAIAAVRGLTAGTPISLHASKDVVGVEVAGAIANVSSLAAGMSDAVDLGETARGMLLAHGLADAKRLGLALGAADATFAGLAGVGELIPRRVTSAERHLSVGADIASGMSTADAVTKADGHVEGIDTAREAVAKAKSLEMEVPLVAAVDAVLRGEASAKQALEKVLAMSLELEGTSAVRA